MSYFDLYTINKKKYFKLMFHTTTSRFAGHRNSDFIEHTYFIKIHYWGCVLTSLSWLENQDFVEITETL